MAKKKAAEDDGAKKGGKLKPIVIGVVALALVYQFVLKKPAPEAAAKEGDKAAVELEEGHVVALEDEMTINLAGPGALHYLRVGLALVLEKGVTEEAIEPELPLAKDVAIDVLSARTFDQLREPGAKQEIKHVLSEKVRKAFHDEKVVRVVFTSFVMQ